MSGVAARLTLLSIAYPFALVGPDAVGGAEQILNCLDAALVRAGHRSIVIAPEGSRCKGELIPLPLPRGPLDAAVQGAGHVKVREALADTLQRVSVDLLHFHGVDFAAYLPAAGPPALATLHLPVHYYPSEALFPRRPGVWLHCVSESQQRDCPPNVLLRPPVPNGVDLETLRPVAQKREFALLLGRICPEKSFHEALDAAKEAGVPVVLAGKVFPYPQHQQYFREQIEPRLGPGARFVGPVGMERKRRLLAEARCLIVSSRVPETSSLVSMEALASGTPVVAFRTGALPEIVRQGRTGLLVSTVAEMAQALREVETIDPDECRRDAEQRFSVGIMVERYFALYRQIVTQAVHA
jgi:glycosyltransferase involved in cell wall biosynthesis